MKMNTIEVIQLINAGAMLGFSLSYVLFCLNSHHAELGIVAWIFSLPFLYFINFLTIPRASKEQMNNMKAISIFSGWFFLFFFLWQLSKSTLLMILTVVFFFLLTLGSFCQIKNGMKFNTSKK
ncbi:MAG: hypothetical protein HXS44_04305 [Theionarchaea archaeon]|nr:hypothetical protein [Theionarchaea archaeon]